MLNLTDHDSDMAAWEQLVNKLRNPGPSVKVALVGKYVQLNDAYLSVVEALQHACIAQDASLDLHWVCAEQIEACLLYTSPSPRDLSTSRMPSSA